MKRRQFIRIAAAGTAATALPAAAWSMAGAPLPQDLAVPQLIDLLGSPEAVRDIGRAYREAYPSERSVAALTRPIVSDARLTRRLSQTQLRDRLDEQIRDDFARDQTVRLHGWVLSRTEARQAALFSILA